MPHLRREESASLELSSLCSLHTKRAKEGNTEIEVGEKGRGGKGQRGWWEDEVRVR